MTVAALREKEYDTVDLERAISLARCRLMPPNPMDVELPASLAAYVPVREYVLEDAGLERALGPLPFEGACVRACEARGGVREAAQMRTRAARRARTTVAGPPLRWPLRGGQRGRRAHLSMRPRRKAGGGRVCGRIWHESACRSGETAVSRGLFGGFFAR